MNDAVRKKDDGGPAFPVAWSDGDGQSVAVPGMTLRDYFAGQALVGFAANPSKVPVVDGGVEVAKASYILADAMLAARRSPSEQHPETQG